MHFWTCNCHLTTYMWFIHHRHFIIFLLASSLLLTLHILTCQCHNNWCFPTDILTFTLRPQVNTVYIHFYLLQSNHVNNTHDYIFIFLIIMLSGWTIILFRKARLIFHIFFLYCIMISCVFDTYCDLFFLAPEMCVCVYIYLFFLLTISFCLTVSFSLI